MTAEHTALYMRPDSRSRCSWPEGWFVAREQRPHSTARPSGSTPRERRGRRGRGRADETMARARQVRAVVRPMSGAVGAEGATGPVGSGTRRERGRMLDDDTPEVGAVDRREGSCPNGDCFK